MFKRFAVALCCLLGSVNLQAGQTPVTTPTLPTDAAEYFAQATKLMDFRAEGASPFELRATFSVKETDKVVQTGTYRELWRSPNTWRRESMLGSTKITEICSNDSYFTEGLKGDKLPTHIFFLRANLIASFPDHAGDKYWTMASANVGGTLFTRAEIDFPATKDTQSARAAAFYFTPGTARLRVAQQGNASVTFNDLQAAGPKLVARKVSIMLPPSTEIDAEIQSIAFSATLADASFDLPQTSNTKCMPAKMVGSSTVIRGEQVEPIRPQHPAGQHLRNGEVEVHFTIGIDGVPKNFSIAKTNGGEYDRPAIEDIKAARWQPSLRNGEPVEVDEVKTIHFR